MNNSARAKALRAIAKLTNIDLAAAVKAKRHNPILDSEIDIEEELINLKESLDTFHSAGETLREYPKMYAHIVRERRAIMKHCLGLAARMLHGRALPRPYSKRDADEAIARLVQLVVLETKRAGQRLDDELLDVFRPFLTVRQRVILRDWSIDLILKASQLQRASDLAGKLPVLRSR
jgi:hypothetical protein